MGGLFSAPKAPEVPKAATDAQDRAQAQADEQERRRKAQLASQKRAATYGGSRQVLYGGREDAALGVPTGSGALGSSTV